VERSDGVAATFARIMKMIDRSNESLPRSISHFESLATSAEASPKTHQPVASIRVGPQTDPRLSGDRSLAASHGLLAVSSVGHDDT
jgi:hypothetical protein